MKLKPNLLRRLNIGESVIITDSGKNKVKGQGDISSTNHRLKPMKFKTKILFLVDPKSEIVSKCSKITRIL